MNPSQQIDKYISGITDWRGKILEDLHKIILEADPEVVEEWKWGCPVWSHKGLVCSISAFKNNVKITFFKGASLKDSHKLFNAGLDAKTMRSIDFHEGDKIDKPKLKDLIKKAIDFNVTK